MFHRRVLIVDEDLGIPVRTENRWEAVPRMSVAGVDVLEDRRVADDSLGRPVITEIIREPEVMTEERSPFGRVFHDGDLAVLVQTITQGNNMYVPAGQVVLILTRDENDPDTTWSQDEFVRCLVIGGVEMGIAGRCLMLIAYDGDTPQAHELMALFGGMNTSMMREAGA